MTETCNIIIKNKAWLKVSSEFLVVNVLDVGRNCHVAYWDGVWWMWQNEFDSLQLKSWRGLERICIKAGDHGVPSECIFELFCQHTKSQQRHKFCCVCSLFWLNTVTTPETLLSARLWSNLVSDDFCRSLRFTPGMGKCLCAGGKWRISSWSCQEIHF